MANLFESVEDLKESGYLFRITDNGGETADRFTIITCDGDYFGSSADPFFPLGFFQSGDSINLQALDDRIETGEERDLRWIDLPEDVRRATLGALNDGWRAYLERNRDQGTRRDAMKYVESGGAGIYRTKRGLFVIPAGDTDRAREDDYGPFKTLREALLASLPQDYDLSGPEYHTPLDLWDETGGPRPLWDCREEPPHPFEIMMAYRGPQERQTSQTYIEVGEARDADHGRELAAKWREENPDLSADYEALIGSKADRTFNPLV